MEKGKIVEAVNALGGDVCGFAGIDRFAYAPAGFHPWDILSNAQTVIVFGKQNRRGVFEAETTIPYSLVRNTHYLVMDNISVRLLDTLEDEGHMAVPIPANEPYTVWGRGILSLKHAGELAGLGWIGRNTLLTTERFGNRLWLGAVVTDAVIEQDPLVENRCPPNCRICLDACPQKALDGVTIDQPRCRERSFSWTEDGGLVIECNMCRKMCPFSRR